MGAGRKDEGDTFVIRDLATLKAMADPLRNRIVGLLDTARTVRDLADRLDRPADRLYYHLRLLEQHGIVRTTADGHPSQRRYILAAVNFVIDPALTMPAVAVEKLVAGILETVGREHGEANRRASADRKRGRGDGVKRSMLALNHVMLDEEERQRVTDLLRDITEQQAQPENRRPGARRYGIVTGIWPADDGGSDVDSGDEERGVEP